MQIKLFQTRIEPDYLEADQHALNAFMGSVDVRKTATQFVPADPDFWSILVFYDELNGAPKTSPRAKVQDITEDDLDADGRSLLSALKTWRRDKAAQVSLPDFMISPNASLIGVAKQKPRSLAELERIKGFGPQKIAKYGEEIMAVVNAF